MSPKPPRHPEIRVHCVPLSLTDSAQVTPLAASSSAFSEAIILAGGEPSEPGWQAGRLAARWGFYEAGTLLASSAQRLADKSLCHVWFITGRVEALWEGATHVDLRREFGPALAHERRWPDWARFSALGPVQTFEPREHRVWTWSDFDTFLKQWDFSAPAWITSTLRASAAEARTRAPNFSAPLRSSG